MTFERVEAAFWAGYLRNRNVEAGTAADGAVAIAGGFALCAAGTFLEYAIGLGSARPLRADDLGVLRAFYAARDLPARIEASEDVLARDGTLLRRAGFVEDGATRAVLEGPAHSAEGRDGVAVRQVADRRGWIALVVRAFADVTAPEDTARLRRAMQLAAAAAHGLFIATVDGTEAGGGAVALAGDRAFLFSAAVLPAFRGRGVHRALVRARLAFGAARGAQGGAVTVIAGSAGERSFRGLGFRRTQLRVRLHAPS